MFKLKNVIVMLIALTLSQIANANVTYDFTASYDSGTHAGYTAPTPLTGFITLASNADGFYSDDSFGVPPPDFPFTANVVDFAVTDGLTTDSFADIIGFGSALFISGGAINNGYLLSGNFYVGSNFSSSYNQGVIFNPATFTLRQVAAAVPEPETYGMMLLGLGLLGFAARRKQKTMI